MTATILRFPKRRKRADPAAEMLGALLIAALAFWAAVLVAVCSWGLSS